jgi:hypothetical protein
VLHWDCTLRLKVKRGALAAVKAEVGRICSTNTEIFWIILHSPHFAFWQIMNRRTNSIGAAERQGTKRQSADTYSM